MAMVDYGSVVKKNSVIIQEEMFMDMKESVGFAIDEINDGGFTVKVNDNFFSYIGDEELLVCVYKHTIVIISNNKVVRIIHGLDDWKLPYKKQSYKFTINGVDFKIKRLCNVNRYRLTFKYKNNNYECIYGYGIYIGIDKWTHLSRKEQRFINKWFK